MKTKNSKVRYKRILALGKGYATVEHAPRWRPQMAGQTVTGLAAMTIYFGGEARAMLTQCRPSNTMLHSTNAMEYQVLSIGD